MLFRHKVFRKEQERLVEDIYNAINGQKNFMGHAPTGLGKTDATLSAALTAAEEHGYDVFFVTPKNSQHEIAHKVVKGIADKYALKMNSVDLVGKRHMCNLRNLGQLPSEDFYHACHLRVKRGQCICYDNARRRKGMQLDAQFNYSHRELQEEGVVRNVCGYELALEAASKSRVIIADYAHVLMPGVVEPLMKRAGKGLSNSVVIVDEAHNLSGRMREELSIRLSERALARARKECAQLESESLAFVSAEFNGWAELTLGKRKEQLLEKEKLSTLLEREGQQDLLVEELISTGNRWVEETGAASACLRIARFIEYWNMEAGEEKFARIISRNEHGYAVEKRCLSPDIITSKLNLAASAILVSGTMLPMEMHRDIIGLDPERTVMREYENPFPRENKLSFVDRDVTTRFSRRVPGEYRRMGRKISEMCAITPGNTAVFFPSYRVMNSVLPHMDPGDKEMIVQQKSMETHEIKRVKNMLLAEDRFMLIGVQGGSLSEGVDYEKNSLKSVIVVGIPLEEMTIETKARIEYYEKRFGKGWEYGYLGPAVTKSVQAAGRCIRSSEDRGVIVFMDERFEWEQYRKYLGKLVEGRRAGTRDVLEFWRKNLSEE